ncbi:restriction endonuclease subunit S [Ligilactobacillus ruminis]|uniref:Restriction endonuclease subunit S n=1 Tax=Ligilactobacillus ruminis TaxID=1623 RepID=A0A8B2Z4Y6_9LACO|nr:restriction endonuclease subunit S [Ligilactobacillus ruminis]RGK46833.1 restriction endonuclease subunit S [Ligilactobacillus ruminis]
MKCKLSDICDFRKGKVDVSKLTLKTYISTENMLPNKGGITDASSLPTIQLTQEYKKGDVLISNIRPYFKKIWRAKYDGGCSNDVLVFQGNSNIDGDFLYYVLANDDFFDYSMATSKGTKMPRGDKASIMQYEVPVFDVDTQRKIASVLRCLDEKIELNSVINKNLEQQLHILFIKIFNGINTDVILGDVVDTTSGGTPSRKHTEYYENGSICWVKSKELLGNYIMDTEEHINDIALSKSSAKLLPNHSVLIAMYGATVGAHGIISKSMACNQAVCALLCNKKYPYTYLFQIVQEQQQKLINMAVGSAQQNISQILIKQLPLHSDISSIRKFHDLALPLHKQIEELQAENRALSKMRDTLLPQLMSGELDVSDIDL